MCAFGDLVHVYFHLYTVYTRDEENRVHFQISQAVLTCRNISYALHNLECVRCQMSTITLFVVFLSLTRRIRDDS